MRVVLDTNVLISACWKPGGLEAQTVTLATSDVITACVTPHVWAEYRDVLMRDKFISVRGRAVELLAELESHVVMVQPGAPVQVSTDDDDNRFLECAAAAQAEYLITGNLRHYPSIWGTAKILNAREFLILVFREERDCEHYDPKGNTVVDKRVQS